MKHKKLTEEQVKAFEAAAKPMIQWLCENVNPHSHALIDCTSAELVSGELMIQCTEFIKD